MWLLYRESPYNFLSKVTSAQNFVYSEKEDVPLLSKMYEVHGGLLKS